MGSYTSLSKGEVLSDSGLVLVSKDGYEVTSDGSRHRQVIVRCACGREFRVRLSNATAGRTKSCGCLSNAKKNDVTTHPLYPLYTQVLTPENDVIKMWEDRPARFFKWAMRTAESYDLSPDVLGQARLIKIDNSLPWSSNNCRIDLGGGRYAEPNHSFWTIEGVKYATAEEAAKALDVSVTTIYNWCKGYNNKGIMLPPKEGCSVASTNAVNKQE